MNGQDRGPPTRPSPSPTTISPALRAAFVGRTAELKKLARRPSPSRGRSVITQPRSPASAASARLSSPYYVYAHLADYDLIRWLRAEQPATLAADYTSLGPALSLETDASDQDALIAAIRKRLERTPRWLLIFDNATAPSSLDPYLPTLGGGHVIVTSRRQDWSDTAQPLELGLLPEADAVAILMRGPRPTTAQRGAAVALAQDLDRLPLALAQARAFMRGAQISVSQTIGSSSRACGRR